MAAIRGKASCALKHDMCVALLDAGCPLESVAKVVRTLPFPLALLCCRYDDYIYYYPRFKPMGNLMQ